MKKFLSDLLKRVSSRKFLLAFSGAITLALNQQWTEFVGVITAYLIAEGAGDAVERFKGGVSQFDSYVNTETDDDEVDTTVVETGKPIPTDTPLFNEELKEED